MMNILFLGGDKRQLEIVDDLSKKHHQLTLVGYDDIEISHNVIMKKIDDLCIDDFDIIVFPVNGVQDDRSITASFSKKKNILTDDFLINTKKDVLIFTGIMTNKLKEMLIIAKRNATILMDDDEVKEQNSVPTVEGIISNLINNTDYTINEATVLVLGYGKVGKRLVDKLRCLGAYLTVGVILEEDYDHLKKQKIKVFYTTDLIAKKKALSQNDIVINTVPSLLIDKDALTSLKMGTYLLDISSYPHGVDFKEADNLKIKYKLWLGIPAEVAPKTAGRILTKKIDNIIRGK